jgi:maleate isomerase
VTESLSTEATFVPYARRLRVGVLTIPDEISAPEEIRAMLPAALSIYQHRVEFDEVNTVPNQLAAMTALTEGARILARTRPQVMAFACTSGGIFAGRAWHDQMLARVRTSLTNISFFSAADAVGRVLRDQGIETVALGSPYSEATIDGLIEVLAGYGVRVVANSLLFADGYPDPWTVMSTQPNALARFATAVDHPQADAVFVSCAGLPLTPVMETIEQQIGKPLVTSNGAVAHVIRQELSLPPTPGFGSILAGRRLR